MSGYSVGLCYETKTPTWLKSSLSWFSFLSAELITLLDIVRIPLCVFFLFFFLAVSVISVVFLNHPRETQGNPSELSKRTCSESEDPILSLLLGCGVLTASNISRVCAAETQNRARASARGVAGNPTTTTPIFLFNRCLAKALREMLKRRLTERWQNYTAKKEEKKKECG